MPLQAFGPAFAKLPAKPGISHGDLALGGSPANPQEMLYRLIRKPIRAYRAPQKTLRLCHSLAAVSLEPVRMINDEGETVDLYIPRKW